MEAVHCAPAIPRTLHETVSYHALMHDVVTLGHEWAATQNLHDILDARPYTCDGDEAFSAQLRERSHALAARIAEQATTALLRAAEQTV